MRPPARPPARAVAHRAGFSGRITGVDLSPYLVAAAARLASEEGVAERLDLRTAAALRRDSGEGAFFGSCNHLVCAARRP